MNIKRYAWTIILTMTVAILCIATVNVSAGREKKENLMEEAEIREVIRIYFDKRYH